MNIDLLTELQLRIPRLKLRFHVPWSDLTSLGAGSVPAPVVAEPADERELMQCLKFTHENGLSVFFVAGGTNLVGLDSPYPGLIFYLRQGAFQQIKSGKHHIVAGSAVRMPELALFAANAGFAGMGPLAGIPGRLGGAVRMNAGANGHTISEYVVELTGCRLDGSLWTAESEEIEWNYRSANIPADVVVTAAVLRLPPGNPAEEIAAIRLEQERRREREPVGRSAGCMFRNISPADPAGRLIDACGLKGLHVGDAFVSDKHANFLLNRGGAGERDVVTLMKKIRERVATEYGFFLTPEVRFINPASLDAVMESPQAPRIAVLKGGNSAEREISLRSGEAVATALRNAGMRVEEIDLDHCAVTPAMKEADLVYPVLHGGFGESGELQALMEKERIEFIGSGSAASEMVLDKIITKSLLTKLGLPTAPWAVVEQDNRTFPRHLHFPVVLKAPREGSSIGIIKVDRQEDWESALNKEFEFDDALLVEQFIEGRELTVPIVNDDVLPIVEIHTPNGFYDFDAKYVYDRGQTRYACPPDTLSPKVQKEAGRLALEFAKATGCRDILRVDFMVDKNENLYILEGNTLPGCTATSLVPKAAKAAGISFERMVAGLVQNALWRKEENIKK